MNKITQTCSHYLEQITWVGCRWRAYPCDPYLREDIAEIMSWLTPMHGDDCSPVCTCASWNPRSQWYKFTLLASACGFVDYQISGGQICNVRSTRLWYMATFNHLWLNTGVDMWLVRKPGSLRFYSYAQNVTSKPVDTTLGFRHKCWRDHRDASRG